MVAHGLVRAPELSPGISEEILEWARRLQLIETV